jgi:hypothetical protein
MNTKLNELLNTLADIQKNSEILPKKLKTWHNTQKPWHD